MKLLISFRHRKAVEPFVDLVESLGARGHQVVVAVHERDNKVPLLFRDPSKFEFVTLPDGRRDAWSETVELSRHARDLVRYLRPAFADATKLRHRVFERFVKHLAVPPEKARGWSAEPLVGIGPKAVDRLERVLAYLERAVPPDEVTRQTLVRIAPDAVVTTPLVHFGSSQVELVKAARAEGIPVGMLLFSWDNLSTKGALHVEPDHLFVWNEQQRREAEELHGFPAERVSITGAPRFDRFFELSGLVSREAFCASFNVPTTTPIVLYLCSSRLVTEKEIRFLRTWIEGIRESDAPLRDALLLVRPHPDLPLTKGNWFGPERTFHWDGLPDVELRTRALFGDKRAVTLASDFAAAQVLYESIHHSAAVVGLNTSAEIEAGIVGRPIFTVPTEAQHADGQQTTLHFHYLLESNGGFVKAATSLKNHLAQLHHELTHPTPAESWQGRVASFVRPGGWHRSATGMTIEALERILTASREAPGPVPSVTNEASVVAPGAPRFVAAATSAKIRNLPVDVWAARAGGDESVASDGLRETLEWMRGRIGLGDVVYDFTAGNGWFAVAASRMLGCTVFAFEAALPSLAVLWQNVLLNAADGSVVPLPLRVAGRASLGQERYDKFDADAVRLGVRASMWREHAPQSGSAVIQPVLNMPIDWMMDRLRLPRPFLVRATLDGDMEGLLAAITAISAAAPALKVIVLEGEPSRLDTASPRIDALGFSKAAGQGTGMAAFESRAESHAGAHKSERSLLDQAHHSAARRK